MLESVLNFFQRKGGDTWLEFVYMLSQIRAKHFQKNKSTTEFKREMQDGWRQEFKLHSKEVWVDSWFVEWDWEVGSWVEGLVEEEAEVNAEAEAEWWA